MKVHILPLLPDGPDLGDGGIRQVIRAQHQFLPEFGWEIVGSPGEADVIACHVEIPKTYLRLYGNKPFVVHNHGAYWTPDYEWWGWCYEANVRLLEALRVADATTAVSEWTAHALRRHSSRDVRVVHHGIDLDEWRPLSPAERRDYVLWNKTRIDPICDPQPVLDLAIQMRERTFVTTFLPHGTAKPFNVTMTGKLAFSEGADVIARAGVYLCTTRETFGIGTLEALACGVPVVGYEWGGQREIISHGVDGWLVPPGDLAGLAEGIHWALGNTEAQAAARRKAEQFPVRESVGKYAAIYAEVLDRFEQRATAPAVSVIVTAYNLAAYLPACLDSVRAQDTDDWECVIVDDASPDDCGAIADEYAALYPEHFRVIHNPVNLYLAGARNAGIAAARGRYLLPLDADDMLAPGAVGLLAHSLDQNRDTDIAYGNVRFVDEDGVTPTRYATSERPGYSGWPVEFRLDWMLERPGQPLPYASMYRREVWALTGGYRTRARSSEDCDMWIRATSYGFVARMVTQADTLVYRNRPNSMSRVEGWEEHRGWYPWTRDAAALPAAAFRGSVPGEQIPFPALDPVVSVVIPVGPGHGRYVQDAVDSVDSQSYRLWECIVVNDSGEDLPPLPTWARVLCSDPACPCIDGDPCHYRGVSPMNWPDPRGVAAARNRGVRAARTGLYLPLDADDVLQPPALDLMVRAHFEDPQRPVVYSDFWDEQERGSAQVYQCPDADVLVRGLINRGLGRAATALTPVRYWREVGGYDETLPAWEDWAFAISCASKGFCERRVAVPLFTYRKWTGLRREENMADFDRSRAAIIEWSQGVERTQGGELMACGSCGAGRGTMGIGPMSAPQGMHAAPPPEGLAMVEYVGSRSGDVIYRSRVAAQAPYRFSISNRQQRVRAEDLATFEGHLDFRIVPIDVVAAATQALRAATGAPVLVAAGPPGMTFGGATASGASGLPNFTPAPASVAVAEPPAPSSAPADVLGGSMREAAAAAAAPAEDPEVATLVREHKRSELNGIAIGLGIANADTMSNMTEVARAIVGVRRLQPSG